MRPRFPYVRLLFFVAAVSVSMATALPALAAGDCPGALSGAWRGSLAVGQLFRVRLIVSRVASDEYVAEIASGRGTEKAVVWRDGSRLRFQSATRHLAFAGAVPTVGTGLEGFIESGRRLEHVVLPAVAGSGRPAWSLDWSPLGVADNEVRLDLYIADDGAGGLGGYFFFRDQRLPSLWGEGVVCQGHSVRLAERNLALGFEGTFDPQRDVLELTATSEGVSVPILFERMAEQDVPRVPDLPEAPPRGKASEDGTSRHDRGGRAPGQLDDGWVTATPAEEGIDPRLASRLVRAVVSEELELTHSVLVARHGRLVLEEYFYGFDRDTLHDMRSASKTLASTLTGLAIRNGRIPGVESTALGFFPRYRRYGNWDPRKAQITVRDLLTMASGLDANDSDPHSTASEGAYESQTARPDWIKLALDAPMIDEPGRQPLYGGANPLILGGILEAALGEPVEWFAHRTLFGPLGIERYSFFLDPTGIPYMGGGMYMRPRDMARIGQLYLDGGVWRGERILPQSWIAESWGDYGRLRPLERNGHPYGYLWWHHRYDVGGVVVETVEARGNGGQYIFVVPSLDLVTVVTSGNFRTGKTRQPEEILGRFVLPAVSRP